MHRFQGLVISGILAIGVAGAAFVGVRALRHEDATNPAMAQSPPRAPTPSAPAVAPTTVGGSSSPVPSSTPRISATPLPSNPDMTKPLWFVPYLEADWAKPVAELTIAGIRVGPSASNYRPGSCYLNTITNHAPESDMLGTPVSISPKYLPSGASLGDFSVSTCRTQAGQVVVWGASARGVVPANKQTGQLAAIVRIFRYVSQQGSTEASIPAERWREGRVAGRAAAIADPILANGFGDSMVIVYMDGVITKVSSDNLPLNQLLQIAEGLF